MSLKITFLALAVVAVNSGWLLAEDEGPRPGRFKVTYRDLHLKVVASGVVDVKDDHAVECKIKTGSRGAPKIKWVVANGQLVRKGDLILEIDDSYLQEQADVKKIECSTARAQLAAAEAMLPIREEALRLARAERRVKNAESELDEDRLALKKFDEGGKEGYRKDVKARLADAEANVELHREYLARFEKELKDGTITEALVKANRKKLEACELLLEQARAEADTLEKVFLPRQRKLLERAIETAERALDQARTSSRAESTDAEASLKCAQAEVETLREMLKHQEAARNYFLEQLRHCKIYAPASGRVIYQFPAEGGGQAVVGKGQAVQYGHVLLTIPDPSFFVLKVQVSETLVGYLRKGQRAHVEVAGLKLKARVEDVTEKPDVAVNSCTVRLLIDDSVEEVKYRVGSTGRGTIFTDLRTHHVLAIPLRAAVTPLEAGKKPRCQVVTPRGVEEREIELGLSDGQMVEVKAGLKEGEVVVDGR